MVDAHKSVTDREADASVESLDTGDVVPADEFLHRYDIDRVQTGPAENGGSPSQLAPAELKLLRAIVENPMRRSSEYAKLAGMSPNTLLKIRPVLVEKGLIRENKLETARRGRAAILLEPLEPAKQLVTKCKE